MESNKMEIQYMSDLHLNKVWYVFENEHLANGFDPEKLIEI